MLLSHEQVNYKRQQLLMHGLRQNARSVDVLSNIMTTSCWNYIVLM